MLGNECNNATSHNPLHIPYPLPNVAATISKVNTPPVPTPIQVYASRKNLEGNFVVHYLPASLEWQSFHHNYIRDYARPPPERFSHPYEWRRNPCSQCQLMSSYSLALTLHTIIRPLDVQVAVRSLLFSLGSGTIAPYSLH